MAKKRDIVAELTLVVKQEQKKIIESNSKLAAANDLYNKLLRNGTIKKRGNTLRGIDDYKLIRHSVTNSHSR